ncbi:MFS transporter [Streptomyces sp. XM4193]|uniref:MFS transporter n=1 Tax=Streptomyces sp. XM4193 TaxID=2929782 RepID=UPI001FFB15B8|nr:MFS transporter [Streptomyces sp. XM4193]MCK1796891.1 MFS transporter [Streptomyces sp. XM4193]
MTAGRLAAFARPGFPVFFAGHLASQLGSAMTPLALAFTALDISGSLSDLSLVMASRILPVVLMLPIGGVLGDRLPRRALMMAADCLRASALALLAVLCATGRLELWSLVALTVLSGAGEAFFRPAYEGTAPLLVPRDALPDANALLGLAFSAATIAGPALSGALVALGSPAWGLSAAAGAYLLTVLLLFFLPPVDARGTGPASSYLSDLRYGWREFTARPWVCTLTAYGALFNLLVWGPYLVLGPASADREYGGAGDWGAVMALYGVGAVCGGLLVLGRRPAGPLVVAVACGFATVAPPAALAFTAPLPVVCAAAALAGVGIAVNMSLWMTTVQHHVPLDSLSRVNSYVTMGAFVGGPVGMALAGPVAESVGVVGVLGFAAVFQLLLCATVLALPAVRAVRWETAPASASSADRATQKPEPPAPPEPPALPQQNPPARPARDSLPRQGPPLRPDPTPPRDPGQSPNHRPSRDPQ